MGMGTNGKSAMANSKERSRVLKRQVAPTGVSSGAGVDDRFDSVLEHLKAGRDALSNGELEARPVRVARPVEVAVGVRHQGEDAPGGVADAGDRARRTVVVVGVAQGD